MSVPRFVTAASLFDGHDAAINIMRRILQRHGAEVIHLGHDRSVDEVVEAAIAEDVHGIALSSYQGGHVEYFRYLVERLRAEGAGHVRVFGGGGGVISPAEVDELHAAGVTRIFTPEDGQRLGLDGMIDSMIAACDVDLAASGASLDEVEAGSTRALARLLSVVEGDGLDAATTARLREVAGGSAAPVLGITGTGGSGKSSLTDELVRRFRIDQRDELRIAVLAIDPTRRRGGALLGDRIRMNAIHSPQVVFRSLATRHPGAEVPERLDVMIDAARVWGADLVIIETPGIGQGDAGIVEFADVSLYVMTPEFGAPTQLEKIDMLDFADVVAINKSDRRGGADALRAVARQLVRNRAAFDRSPDDMAVFATVASRFDDPGVTELYRSLRDRLAGRGLATSGSALDRIALDPDRDHGLGIVPGNRVRYLADVADAVRSTTRPRSAAPQRCGGSASWNEQPGTSTQRVVTRPRQRSSLPSCATSSTPATSRCWRRGTIVTLSSSAPIGRYEGRWPAPRCRASRCRTSRTPAICCDGCAPSICRARSRTPRACSTVAATTRTRRGCSRGRAARRAPTPASICSPRASPPPGCPPPSTR